MPRAAPAPETRLPGQAATRSAFAGRWGLLIMHSPNSRTGPGFWGAATCGGRAGRRGGAQGEKKVVTERENASERASERAGEGRRGEIRSSHGHIQIVIPLPPAGGYKLHIDASTREPVHAPEPLQPHGAPRGTLQGNPRATRRRRRARMPRPREHARGQCFRVRFWPPPLPLASRSRGDWTADAVPRHATHCRRALPRAGTHSPRAARDMVEVKRPLHQFVGA